MLCFSRSVLSLPVLILKHSFKGKEKTPPQHQRQQVSKVQWQVLSGVYHPEQWLGRGRPLPSNPSPNLIVRKKPQSKSNIFPGCRASQLIRKIRIGPIDIHRIIIEPIRPLQRGNVASGRGTNSAFLMNNEEEEDGKDLSDKIEILFQLMHVFPAKGIIHIHTQGEEI